MAVPWINLLAPSMGGIGPIELEDFSKLQRLKNVNGVPFYAGRFYPKDSDAIISEFTLGFFSETPPWLTWETIKNTQIWMVPNLPNERVLSTTTKVTRIDLWPRDDDDDPDTPPPITFTSWDTQMQNGLWGAFGGATTPSNDTIDPGIIVTQNVLPPLLFAGYIAISQISGYVSEYGFYDQEFMTVNSMKYGQFQYQGKARAYNENKFLGKEEEYQEIWRYRTDGIWVKKDATITPGVALEFPNGENGYPSDGYFKEVLVDANQYKDWAVSDKMQGKRYGNDKWDYYSQVNDGPGGLCQLPQVGVIAGYKPTQLDTLVYTIKVSCVSVILPNEPLPNNVSDALVSLQDEAIQTFGANVNNNIWYFYLPVRYNGDLQAERVNYLFQRAAININENLLCKQEDYQEGQI